MMRDMMRTVGSFAGWTLGGIGAGVLVGGFGMVLAMSGGADAGFVGDVAWFGFAFGGIFGGIFGLVGRIVDDSPARRRARRRTRR